ncbi:MAG: hypothetical protein KH828_09730 [Clostridiales bacterium]|nr:hypothetical protein [Clostridiales bacterium]
MSHLFLTGPSGIGKSTMLWEALNAFPCKVSGFFTQRLLLPDHTMEGFRLLSWERNLPVAERFSPGMEDIFIRKEGKGWKKDLSVFAGTGVRLLENCLPQKRDRSSSPVVICLDEIGGTELLVPEFRTMLYTVLASHPCCIGVIKSRENLSAMFTRVFMNSEEETLLFQLHEDLTHRFCGQILPVTETNREQVRQTLRSFLGKIPGE